MLFFIPAAFAAFIIFYCGRTICGGYFHSPLTQLYFGGILNIKEIQIISRRIADMLLPGFSQFVCAAVSA